MSRATFARLTPAGQAALEQAMPVHLAAVEEMFSRHVDDAHRALHLSDTAGRYLQLSGGSVSTDAFLIGADSGCDQRCLALPRVAPPRPRNWTSFSVTIRCTNPYERPVSSARARMLAPPVYFFFNSPANRCCRPGR